MTSHPIDRPDKPNQETGSPQSGEPDFLAIGKLRRPHGVKGDIMMDILTDFPERLRPGKVIFAGDERKPLRLVRIHQHGKVLLVSFEGRDTREAVIELTNLIAYVRTASVPRLPKGEFYYHQLLGLTVVGEDGQALGKLEHIIETKANDVYVVRGEDGSELLLPAVENEVILEVNLEKGEIRVRPPDWE